MTQGIKVITGLLAVITLVLIVSALVWLAATVNQLSKDKDRLDFTTQKLTNSTDELADKVKSLENQSADVKRDARDNRKDIEGLNTVIEEFVLAMGRQLSDIKKVIVEQDNQINTRLDALETANAELSKQVDDESSDEETEDSAQEAAAKPSGRIFVDVNNPGGAVGWKDSYTVQLRFVVADEKNFLIDWYRPHIVRDVMSDKPDIVKKTPKFKNAKQLYFILVLGDATDNRVVGVIDFKPTENKYFPFDLYVDKDRDGDLAEDLIDTENSVQRPRGLKIAYKDGTAEEYALKIYTHQDERIYIWYASDAGRYGVLEANQKRIGILVIDNSGNGLFNDAEDVVLMDWDLDGTIDGRSYADGHRSLYSILELPEVKFRVTEIDPAGRHITLTRMH